MPMPDGVQAFFNKEQGRDCKNAQESTSLVSLPKFRQVWIIGNQSLSEIFFENYACGKSTKSIHVIQISVFYLTETGTILIAEKKQVIILIILSLRRKFD